MTKFRLFIIILMYSVLAVESKTIQDSVIAADYLVPRVDVRIVGGKSTNIENYPYQASFNVHGSHYCGAFLVKPNIAISAAHCTAGISASSITIRAGSSICNKGGQVIKVLRVANHPKYIGGKHDYDVTVLLLEKPFKMGPKIQTIPLASINAVVAEGTLGTVTGWGNLSSGGAKPEQLQVVQVQKVEYSRCNKMYGGELTSRMTCYGYDEGRKDTCQADSGGPLVVGGKVVGIVSWGKGCAVPKFPGIYARVSNPKIYQHIQNSIAKFSKYQLHSYISENK